jgi:hypothetical protein
MCLPSTTLSFLLTFAFFTVNANVAAHNGTSKTKASPSKSESWSPSFTPPAYPQTTKTCVMPKNHTTSAADLDDSPGIVAAINACGNNSRVIFQKGVTYNVFTPWKFSNIHDIEFVFEGNLTLPENVTYVQSVVTNSKIYPGQWIQIRGANMAWVGSKDKRDGWWIGMSIMVAGLI